MKILHLSRYRTGNREYAKENTSFTTEHYTDKHNVKNDQIDKNEPVSGRSGARRIIGQDGICPRRGIYTSHWGSVCSDRLILLPVLVKSISGISVIYYRL